MLWIQNRNKQFKHFLKHKKYIPRLRVFHSCVQKPQSCSSSSLSWSYLSIIWQDLYEEEEEERIRRRQDSPLQLCVSELFFKLMHDFVFVLPVSHDVIELIDEPPQISHLVFCLWRARASAYSLMRTEDRKWHSLNFSYSRIRPQDDLVMANGQIGLKYAAEEGISLDELNLSGQTDICVWVWLQ